MTVNGQTKEIWLSRSENNLDPPRSRYLTFGKPVYELMFDVDRRPLGFRAEARRLRHGVRARHRAADAFHEPGSPD